MYTSFDLFDKALPNDSKLIDKQYLAKRNYLCSKMLILKHVKLSSGIIQLADEPYKDQYFNFDIEKKL